jgi:hypothetical protein
VYAEKSQEYELVISELQRQLADKNEYVKRLEKRNVELEK